MLQMYPRWERKITEESKVGPKFIVYGFNSHLFHLHTKDVSVSEVKAYVTETGKYICNNHFAATALIKGLRIKLTLLKKQAMGS